MDTFAAIALCSEPPRPGVMLQKPKRKDENILTPAMIKTILTTAAFFVVVMMVLLAGMQWGGWFDSNWGRREHHSLMFSELTVRQVSIFFAVYVFFQVWNQINCRSLTPDMSGLQHITQNRTFLAIVGTIAVVQVVLTSVPALAAIFQVEPLRPVDWLVIIVATSTVLIFREVARRLQAAAPPQPQVAAGAIQG
jgi:Ca2+-transporting ATPase